MDKISKELEELKKKKRKKLEASGNTHSRPRNLPMVLTADMNFDVWNRLITGELASLGDSEYLENPENEDSSLKYDVQGNEVKTELNYVSTNILTKVEDSYIQHLCDVQTPFFMIKKLCDLRYPSPLSLRMTL